MRLARRRSSSAPRPVSSGPEELNIAAYMLALRHIEAQSDPSILPLVVLPQPHSLPWKCFLLAVVTSGRGMPDVSSSFIKVGPRKSIQHPIRQFWLNTVKQVIHMVHEAFGAWERRGLSAICPRDRCSVSSFGSENIAPLSLCDKPVRVRLAASSLINPSFPPPSFLARLMCLF